MLRNIDTYILLDGFRHIPARHVRQPTCHKSSVRAGAAVRAAAVSRPPPLRGDHSAPHAPPRTLRAPPVCRSGDRRPATRPARTAAAAAACCLLLLARCTAPRRGKASNATAAARPPVAPFCFFWAFWAVRSSPDAVAGAWCGGLRAPQPVRWFVRSQPLSLWFFFFFFFFPGPAPFVAPFSFPSATEPSLFFFFSFAPLGLAALPVLGRTACCCCLVRDGVWPGCLRCATSAKGADQISRAVSSAHAVCHWALQSCHIRRPECVLAARSDG